MSSSVSTPPTIDVNKIKTSDPQEIFTHITPVIDYLFLAPATTGEDGKVVLPSLDFKVHTGVYTLLYNGTTTVGANSATLYNLMGAHITEVVKKISEELIGSDGAGGANGEQLVTHYLAASSRFDNRATYLDRLCAYLNRHWIKREEDEGRGAKIVMSTWGYPADELDRDTVETCAKAASGDEALVPVRALCLRKWRVLLVEKMKMEVVVEHLKTLSAEQKETVAEQLRKSFWTCGVEPTKPQMVALGEFLPKAPEPVKVEAADEKGKGPAVEPEVKAEVKAEASF